MAKYNVRLTNPWKMWFKRQEIMDEVGRLFEPVAKKAGFEGVNVTATFGEPTMLPSDVLVYLVPNEDYSLLEKAFGEGDGDPAGRTVHERGASEVYIAGPTASANGGGVFMKIDKMGSGGGHFLSIRDPSTVAKVVFHEVLHNKLRLNNTHLHTRKGPADALFRGTILPHSKLSTHDIALLAPKLKNTVKQWTGGWNHLP